MSSRVYLALISARVRPGKKVSRSVKLGPYCRGPGPVGKRGDPHGTGVVDGKREGDVRGGGGVRDGRRICGHPGCPPRTRPQTEEETMWPTRAGRRGGGGGDDEGWQAVKPRPCFQDPGFFQDPWHHNANNTLPSPCTATPSHTHTPLPTPYPPPPTAPRAGARRGGGPPPRRSISGLRGRGGAREGSRRGGDNHGRRRQPPPPRGDSKLEPPEGTGSLGLICENHDMSQINKHPNFQSPWVTCDA